MKPGDTILLTGATGFVGRSLWPALMGRGCQVRSMTRDVESARSRFPQRDWVLGDMSRRETLAPALQGCQAAYYLVHSMAEGDLDLRRREALEASTEAFLKKLEPRAIIGPLPMIRDNKEKEKAPSALEFKSISALFFPA